MGVGGSDAAAILGMDPFRDAFDVWLSKTTELPPEKSDPRKEWGRRLEPIVATAAAEQLKMKLLTPPETFVHATIPFMRANIDGLLCEDKGTRRLLETKVIDRSFADRLGEQYTDAALPEHVIQVSHYLAVMDLPAAIIAYLVGGNDLRIYEVFRSPDLERMIVNAEADFWNNHVLTNEPPEGGKPDVIAKWLAKRFEARDGDTLTVNDGSPMEVVNELRDAMGALRIAKERAETAKNGVRSMLGSSTILAGEWGRITWKSTKKGVRVLRHPWSSSDE